MRRLPPALTVADAISAHNHVVSHLAFAGADDAEPFVTVAIPTYRRPDLLAEAVASVLAQDFDRRVEIIVVDNDPASTGAQELLAALPQLRDRSFRYYVNAENIGMYPNHNRCLKLARGEWVSILNDDDLLRSDCLRVLFATVAAHPEIQAIGGMKTRVDQRAAEIAVRPARWRVLLYRTVIELEYRGRAIRRIKPAKIFWGNVMDNMAGFVARREPILALGGFPPEDEWSADTWFYIRVAVAIGLYQHRERLAIVRIRLNESMRPEVLKSFLRQGVRIRRALVQSVAPRWYAYFEPLAMAEERGASMRFWGVDLPVAEVEQETGVRVVKEHRLVFRWFKLLLGGF